MKKIIPFLLLFSFNAFSNSYDCDLPPYNEDKSVNVDTEKCVAADCQGEYITTGTLVWTCADVYSSSGGTSDRIREIADAYAPNASIKTYCFSASDEITVTATVVFFHNEPNLEDECLGFCGKNAGPISDPVATTRYPTADDVSNGFVTIHNGTNKACSHEDTSHSEACVNQTVTQESFDGTSITTITQTFITENQCSSSGNTEIDMDSENISLEYCNEGGGFYGNQYCDNSDPNYHCPNDDCDPISGGVCEDDPDCNNPPPPTECEEGDPDCTDGGDNGGGETGGGDGSGETGGGDGSGGGETGGGSGGDDSGSTDGSGATTDEGVIAYLESLYQGIVGQNAEAANKYQQETQNYKNEFNSQSTTVDLSTYDFDESGFISNDSCPLPIQIVLPWGTFEIPLDALCQIAEMLSYLVLALAYFFAGRIIVQGV